MLLKILILEKYQFPDRNIVRTTIKATGSEGMRPVLIFSKRWKFLIFNQFRIFSLKIPLKVEVSHHLYSWKNSNSIVVSAENKKGLIGYGEGAPREFVTGEPPERSLQAVQVMTRMLVGKSIDSFDELRRILETVGEQKIARKNPAAWCAVELACLDLWARYRNLPLWNFFKDEPLYDSFFYSAVIPLASDTQYLSEIIKLIKSNEMQFIKVKVADIATGVEALRKVRKELGPDVDLRVDANGAFSPAAAIEFYRSVGTLNISAFEQPVPKEDLEGLKHVARFCDIPVIADESMYTDNGVEYLINEKICSGVNVRISGCGGFFKSYRLGRILRNTGGVWQIGSHVGETAILSLAGRQLAAICNGYRFLEGSFSKFLLVEDIATEDISFGIKGRASLPKGYGIGVDVDEKKLARISNPITIIK
jgi:muconate cycloisomerase